MPNNSMVNKRLFFSLLLFVVLTAPLALVFALEENYPPVRGVGGETTLRDNPLLPDYILYIYRFAIAVSGLVVFGIALYGGIKYLTSGGNAVKKSEGRRHISGGIIGLFILFLSYLLLSTLNLQFTIFQLTKPEGVDVVIPGLNPWAREGDTVDFLEVPMGTLIERILSGAKMQQLREFTEEASRLSSEVKSKAIDLQNELRNCSCTSPSVSPASPCDAASCTGGACMGEPCDRAAVESKKQSLAEAKQKLKDFVEPRIAVLEEYSKDVADLLSADILLKESIEPINYDNFLELKQVLTESDITVETSHYPGLSGLIPAAGYDPMNFYLDKKQNNEIIERYANAEFQLEIRLPSELFGTPPPKRPGTLTWPFPGGILTQRYGCQTAIVYSTPCPTGGWLHAGIDIADATSNPPLYAAADGVVIGVGSAPGCGYGNWVVIWHEALGLSTSYAHMLSVAPGIVPGATVSQSQLIGWEDSTGFVFGEHLHFEVLQGKAWVGGNCFGGFRLDPADYL